MPSERLIERGRLAYQALESREEAARYRAAAADLMEAISLAESGDDSKLKVFLDSMDQKTWPNGIPMTTQVPTHHTPAQIVQLAPVARIEHSQEKTPADSWSQMLQGAQQRAEKVGTAPQSIAKATIAVHSSPIKANSVKARTNSADKVGKNEITPSKVPSSKSSTGKTSTAKPSN
ncbi:MAG: hypothetical protein ACKOAH_12440, partial [Pirellula sp.]